MIHYAGSVIHKYIACDYTNCLSVVKNFYYH